MYAQESGTFCNSIISKLQRPIMVEMLFYNDYIYIEMTEEGIYLYAVCGHHRIQNNNYCFEINRQTTPISTTIEFYETSERNHNNNNYLI